MLLAKLIPGQDFFTGKQIPSTAILFLIDIRKYSGPPQELQQGKG